MIKPDEPTKLGDAGRRRLTILANFLHNLGEEHKPSFDMQFWMIDRGGPPGPECKTTACAIGYAMTIPEFNAAGFGRIEGIFKAFRPAFPKPKIDGQGQSYWIGWDAVENFFGIQRYEAEFLFHLESYKEHDLFSRQPTPQEVAARIMRFIDEH